MKILRAFAAVLVMFVVATAAITQSSAHQTQGSPNTGGGCTAGEVCLYESATLQGGVADYTGSDAWYVGNLTDLGTQLNQNVESVENEGVSCTVYLRDTRDFGGWSLSVAKGTWAQVDGSYANDTSSHHWCTSS